MTREERLAAAGHVGQIEENRRPPRGHAGVGAGAVKVRQVQTARAVSLQLQRLEVGNGQVSHTCSPLHDRPQNPISVQGIGMEVIDGGRSQTALHGLSVADSRRHHDVACTKDLRDLGVAKELVPEQHTRRCIAEYKLARAQRRA